MRMREGLEDLPKPMAMVGDRPLIWHVMRYYAHFGHTEFILCMGYGARHITRYFLDYEETRSNDFVIEAGEVRPLATDIADWKITFCNTGLDTAIGERLRRVTSFIQDDEMFLANYADVLTDLPLDQMIERFVASDVSRPSWRSLPNHRFTWWKRMLKMSSRGYSLWPIYRCARTADTSSSDGSC